MKDKFRRNIDLPIALVSSFMIHQVFIISCDDSKMAQLGAAIDWVLVFCSFAVAVWIIEDIKKAYRRYKIRKRDKESVL